MAEPRHSIVYSRNIKKPVDPIDPALTVKDVAKTLNCSDKHAYELIKEGALPSFTIGTGGKGLRVHKSDLDAMISGLKEKAKAANA